MPLFFALLSPAGGTTLFSTGGTPLIYSTNPANAWVIGNGSSFAFVADSFSLGAAGTLGAVEIGVKAVSGSGTVTVAIETGATPTTVIESLSATPPGVTSTISLPSVLHPVLTAGNYWLVVGTTGNEVIDWFVNAPTGVDLKLSSGGGWIPSSGSSWGAFDLQSAVAPEASSWELSALGMVLFGVGCRLRRKPVD